MKFQRRRRSYMVPLANWIDDAIVQAEWEEKTEMGVRFYREEDAFAIDTDLDNENEFFNAAASGLAKAVMDVKDEAEQAYILRRYSEQMCDIICSMRGYKANVRKKTLIAAGEIMPAGALPINIDVDAAKRVRTSDQITAEA